MSEVKKMARAEIEFDAQGLEDELIEFELEGEEWLARPKQVTSAHKVRNCVREIKYARDELGCSWELAWEVVKGAVGL